MKKKLFVIYEKQDNGEVREAYAKTKIVAANMLNYLLKHKYLDHYCAWCDLRKLTKYDEGTWQQYVKSTHPGVGTFHTSMIKVDGKDPRFTTAFDEKKFKRMLQQSTILAMIDTALEAINNKKKEENKA